MTLGTETVPVIGSIAALGSRYAAWLVDIWGVMHNGLHAHAPAVEATRRYREQGGIVVLLSNSPRPSPGLKHQLRQFGVIDQSYDATVSSGDLTRHVLAQHAGARIFHLGPERDAPIFAGLDVVRVAPAEADLVVCTGLFEDESETPDDYDALLQELAGKQLPMLCANPDRMVERGHRLVYCAGALAEVYTELGGAVTYAGKPHAPIYRLAMATLTGLAGRTLAPSEILAIGDGVRTDMAGAAGFGLDAVFVASGLHVANAARGADAAGNAHLDAAILGDLFEGMAPPRAAMPALAW
jgi:HAD superfamily hydrolase (TIGR01459 family)